MERVLSETNVSDEPIAIIGMSCRFAPDLNSPQAFWEFLVDGRSAVGDMPEKRWQPYASSSPQATALIRGTTLRGSYLDDIEGFDADFFGISPREAEFVDPQQRFVLELAWEALGDAGIAPLSLRGSDASIYVAANSNDYGRRLLEDIPHTGAYAVNGTTYYGIANRVSYFLDLRGPSLAVDTACAGSLTALHLAAQALRAGETPLALVGGVNLMSTPALNVALQATGALAPDGRSKAFDADADGYGRGEGAAVVVLKRLADARRDGDPIQAVILGSIVSQDGRSDGMMAPNEHAQEQMLRDAYARSGLDPSEIDYIEAHGTGTPTGDAKEIEAIAAVFRGRAGGRPLLVGSVKPNVGHVEGGSGITGVVKTVMALRHGQVPPTLHTTPRPDVDWDGAGMRLVAEVTPWPAGERARVAGISSYGVGGTIAHLVLRESPDPAGPPAPAASTGTRIYPLSSMSEAGVRALAGSVADRLEQQPGLPLASVGHTLGRRRSHLPQRVAVAAGTTAELVDRLRAVADGRSAPGVATGRAATDGGVVWVFSGHGSQWSGMGRRLLTEDADFAGAVDGLAGVFAEELGWTPREALIEGGPWSAAHVQALTFAVQVGLIAAWHARGLRPAAVIGHSVGEIAAAVAAGVLDPLPAARFACRRAAALQRLEGRGAMALVDLAFDETRRRLDGHPDVDAAISAAPGSTVISGDRDAVQAVAERWKRDGLDVRMVDTTIAFHSAHVDEVLDEVAAAADRLEPRDPDVPLYSTALDDPKSDAPRDGAYWSANLRRPVRFAEAVTAAVADGHRLFLELSSHPVVAHSIGETLQRLDVEGTVAGSLRRNTDELLMLATNLATLHCHGAELDWSRTQPAGGLVDLPAAAWQHRPYWIFADAAPTGPGGGHDPQSHSLLGGRMTVSGAPARQVWQTRLDFENRPYPLSHELVGVEVTPAASILNTFVAAAGGEDSVALTDIVLRTPLAVVPPRIVQVVKEGRTLSLSTRVADDGVEDEGNEWITHTTATVDAAARPPSGHVDAAPIRARLPEDSRSKVDEMFARMGVGGYAFPWDLDELRRDEHEQLAVMTVEPAPATRATSWAHVIDAALTISAAVVSPGDATTLWMSRTVEKVAFRGEPPARIVVHSNRSPKSPHDTVDAIVADADGVVVAEAIGLRFAPVDHLGSAVLPRDLVHETVWRPITPQPSDEPLDQVVLLGDPDITEPLARSLKAAGVTSEQASSVTGLRPEWPGAILVAPSPARAGEDLAAAAERSAWTLVRTVQWLAELRAGSPARAAQRVWALTSGVRSATSEGAVAQGPVWGIGRIVAGEHPELWGGVVDLGPDPVDGEALAAVLRGTPGGEDVVALTPDGPEALRLAPIERSADGIPLHCSPSGTVLITGGLGALGLEVAHWLVGRGARRLLLAGRRGLPPRADWPGATDPEVRRQIDAVLALEALGVTVATMALDVTDAAQVAALASGAGGLPSITGVVHAAGVVHDDLVDKVDRAGLREVLAPKVSGALNLHRMFPPGRLDFFVLFSSCGQFARLSGQTSYAAANSFLDALAAHRNAGGHSETVSIGWTAWRGVGLSADIATTMFEANSRGLDAVSVDEAFQAWAFGDRFRSSYLAVMRVLATDGPARLPMFRDLTAVAAVAPEAAGTRFAVDLTGLTPAEGLEQVTADVREQVAAELNLVADDIDRRRPLVELGVDSVMTVALRVRLHRRFGLDLPPTILWAKPTVAALSEHLLEVLGATVHDRPGH